MKAAVVGALVASAFALPGAAVARARTAPPQPLRVAASIPPPGGVELTLFELAVPFRAGAKVPNSLHITALDRTKLPRGVTVLGAVRRIKLYPYPTAFYEGVLAVVRSRTAQVAKHESRYAFAAIQHVGAITWRERETLVARDANGLTYRPESPQAVTVADTFRNYSWDVGQAFSWSAGMPTKEGAAADRVLNRLVVDPPFSPSS
jgi:hypothetical protein